MEVAIQKEKRRKLAHPQRAKARFMDLLRKHFNSGVTYKGRMMKWDAVTELKTAEIGRLLIGRCKEIDLVEPSPLQVRADSLDVRGKILSLTAEKAKELGIGKSTLHYLRRKPKNERAFTIHSQVHQRVEQIGNE